MHKLGAEKNTINVVDDQIGTPTYAKDLAEAIVQIVPLMKPENRGIYHYSNMGECSWCDFAGEIMRLSGLKCKVLPISSAEYPTVAKRPKYSVLDKSKIQSVFGIEIPDWKDGLARCVAVMERE